MRCSQGSPCQRRRSAIGRNFGKGVVLLRCSSCGGGRQGLNSHQWPRGCGPGGGQSVASSSLRQPPPQHPEALPKHISGNVVRHASSHPPSSFRSFFTGTGAGRPTPSPLAGRCCPGGQRRGAVPALVPGAAGADHPGGHRSAAAGHHHPAQGSPEHPHPNWLRWAVPLFSVMVYANLLFCHMFAPSTCAFPLQLRMRVGLNTWQGCISNVSGFSGVLLPHLP